MLGSYGDLHADGPRMASHQDVEAGRMSFRSRGYSCNSSRFFGDTVPCVPPAEHQSSQGMGKCAASASVRFAYIILSNGTDDYSQLAVHVNGCNGR
jgi:hypothetical protein